MRFLAGIRAVVGSCGHRAGGPNDGTDATARSAGLPRALVACPDQPYLEASRGARLERRAQAIEPKSRDREHQ
jgi:hypothetical protein